MATSTPTKRKLGRPKTVPTDTMRRRRENLIKLRDEVDLSQAELAALVGMSKDAIAAYEQGKRVGRMDDWITIANVFGLTVEQLSSEVPPRPDSALMETHALKVIREPDDPELRSIQSAMVDLHRRSMDRLRWLREHKRGH